MLVSSFRLAKTPCLGNFIDTCTVDFSLGIPRQLDRPAGGGADIGQLRRLGLPVVDLNHDASGYFDLHHTANDTLAMVDPEAIAFNVAAYVTFVYFTAETDTVFGPVAPSE